MYIGLHVKYCTRYSCQTLMKREFSRQILENYSDIKFHENPFRGSRVSCRRTDGQTDITNLIVAFHNFVTRLKSVRKKLWLLKWQCSFSFAVPVSVVKFGSVKNIVCVYKLL